MTTQYHVYGNGGTGGPVNYATPIATVTSGTSWSTSALAASSSWAFGVRAFDSLSSLEEQNVDAMVAIRLNASGADITNLPIAPWLVSAHATSAGGVRVDWHYPIAAARASWKPQGFHVYAGTPSISSYTTPAATVAYSPGSTSFHANLAGLTVGSAYQITVRAYNASGTETNTVVATVTPSSTGPSAVVGLTIAATSQVGDGRS